MASNTIAGSGLPTSRTDALSVVLLGFISAFTGSTPARGKKIALVNSAITNIWAIVSSALTFRDIFYNPHDTEQHLWLFMMGMLILTVGSSVLMLVSFKVNNRASDTGMCGLWYGQLLVFLVFLHSLVELVLAYTNGCDTFNFADSAVCNYSKGVVVGTVVGVGVGAVVMMCIIYEYSIDRSGSVCKNHWVELRDDEEKPQSLYGPILTRSSALIKACAIGVYWFLVDDDLSWDYTVNGQDTSWWITGQWAKQGGAIANNFLNCLY